MIDLSVRGKCREMSEAAVAADSSLRLVRGHYYCPMANERFTHWWCETSLGEVVDPTAAQFQSSGFGEYEEFGGVINCEECGVAVEEERAVIHGSHALCSTLCLCRLVGLA